MNLRIVSGTIKGRFLSIPDRIVKFRPTKERVRESLAEIIKDALPGSFVADFCAGSGAFGIECASRGANEVHFVERDFLLCRTISAHLETFGIHQKCKVFARDIRQFIKKPLFAYDIIFYDPPYEDETLAGLAETMLAFLSKKGILLYEYSAQRQKQRQALEFTNADRYIFTTRTYGDTAVDLIYKKKKQE
jgi:16S rRNA (guanine966-N2)-methyltransferase